MMPVTSIRSRAMLLLIAICIIITLVLGGSWLYSTHAIIKNNVVDYSQENSRFLATYTDLYLHEIASTMAAISTNPDTIRALQNNDTYGLMQIADNLDINIPQAGVARILDNDGHILYSTAHDNITSIADRAWYDDMAASDSPFITDLYFSRYANESAFAIITPINNNSTILGRIMVIIRPEDIQQNIQENWIAPGFEMIIFDSRGFVVSSSNVTLANDHTDLSSYSPVQMALTGESGVLESAETWDGKDRITAYYPITTIDWGVMTTIPRDTAYMPLYKNIVGMLGILVLVIIGSSVLGFYTTRYLTDPIIGLSNEMQRFSTGGYDITIKPERDDEIGRLADTYNRMVEGIRLTDGRLKSEKALSDLYVDLMSHDINNMNHVGMGYIEIALEKLKDEGKIVESESILLEKAYEAFKNSSQIIDNVKKLQKIKSGEVKGEIVDINKVLADVSAIYSNIKDRDVAINFKPTAACLILADPLVNEVFSNIVGNAVKHTPPDKPLNINIYVEEVREDEMSFCRITIEDNGPGIPDDRKNIIFRHFAHGEGKAKGKGLGLYLVKTLVESYGGKISAKDRVPGDYTKGARFITMLPAIKK